MCLSVYASVTYSHCNLHQNDGEEYVSQKIPNENFTVALKTKQFVTSSFKVL